MMWDLDPHRHAIHATSSSRLSCRVNHENVESKTVSGRTAAKPAPLLRVRVNNDRTLFGTTMFRLRLSASAFDKA